MTLSLRCSATHDCRNLLNNGFTRQRHCQDTLATVIILNKELYETLSLNHKRKSVVRRMIFPLACSCSLHVIQKLLTFTSLAQLILGHTASYQSARCATPLSTYTVTACTFKTRRLSGVSHSQFLEGVFRAQAQKFVKWKATSHTAPPALREPKSNSGLQSQRPSFRRKWRKNTGAKGG